MTDLVVQKQNWQEMKAQATDLVRSGMLPNCIKKPEQAIAIMQKGAELGVPPMYAFAHIHVIQGKPTMSAELMMAQIHKHQPNAQINILRYDNEACEIEAIRPNCKPAKFSFTIEDAKRAELLSNPTWRKYPRAMLRSRCVSEMARTLFSDCISGVSYTAEEIGADVTEDGEIIDIDANVLAIDTIYTNEENQKHFLKASLEKLEVPVAQWQNAAKLICEAEVTCGEIPTALESLLNKLPDSVVAGASAQEVSP